MRCVQDYLFIYTEMVQLRAQRNITVHESSILFVACCFVACCLLLVIYCLLLVACCLSPSFRKQLLYLYVRLINSMGLALYRRYHVCMSCMYMYYHARFASYCLVRALQPPSISLFIFVFLCYIYFNCPYICHRSLVCLRSIAGIKGVACIKSSVVFLGESS